MTTINDCKIIELSKITTSTQGSLTPIYSGEHIPFDIARVYYLYDVPGGAVRGGHAHKELQQLIVAAMGAFSVVLDDGYTKKNFCPESSLFRLICTTIYLARAGRFLLGRYLFSSCLSSL